MKTSSTESSLKSGKNVIKPAKGNSSSLINLPKANYGLLISSFLYNKMNSLNGV